LDLRYADNDEEESVTMRDFIMHGSKTPQKEQVKVVLKQLDKEDARIC
jgi:hypothetical protein